MMSESKNISGTADYTSSHAGYRELDVTDHPEHQSIRLIEPTLHHAAASLAWLSQAEVGQYMGADFSDLSLEGEEERLRKIISSTDEYSWMIELDGQVIGNVCINSIEEQSIKHGCRAGSMAILIGEKIAWGKRIGRFVNKAVIDWAFAEGGFDQLDARIMKENIASEKSFVALGFEVTETEEEILHGKTIHWNHYGMTKERWSV